MLVYNRTGIFPIPRWKNAIVPERLEDVPSDGLQERILTRQLIEHHDNESMIWHRMKIRSTHFMIALQDIRDDIQHLLQEIDLRLVLTAVRVTHHQTTTHEHSK